MNFTTPCTKRCRPLPKPVNFIWGENLKHGEENPGISIFEVSEKQKRYDLIAKKGNSITR